MGEQKLKNGILLQKIRDFSTNSRSENAYFLRQSCVDVCLNKP